MRCHRKNGISGESGESLPHPPDAVPPRLWRGRADRVVRPYRMSEAPRLPYVKYSTGTNITTYTIYRAVRKPDWTVARRAFLDRKCNGNTRNGTTRLFARKRYFRVQRLFFAYFFLARQKKVCPRSDSYSVAVKRNLV